MPRRVKIVEREVETGDAQRPALDLAPIAGIAERVGDSETDLIPVLQKVQGHYGYLPEAVVTEVARVMGIPASRVFGVVTFYAQFSTIPRGRHRVCVCQGTACHVRGGRGVLRVTENELGIRPGETAADLSFSLETVACLGACSRAPVITVDGTYHGKLTAGRVPSTLEQVIEPDEGHDDG